MIQKNGEVFEFPAITKVSFHSLIEVLEENSKTGDKSQKDQANDLLEVVEKHPFLKDGFEDYSFFEKYKEPISMLSRALFPDALLLNEIKGLTPPFAFEPFYVSTRFQNIMNATGDDKLYGPSGFTPEMMYIMGCTAILNSYYGMPVDLSTPLVLEIPNANTGLLRSYRVAFNADMIDIYPTDNTPKITEEDYQELINDFDNIALWKEKFPPDSYIMKGIGVVNLMDVTMDASV
ncbi:MAG: GAF domain-containing protein, partial [Bacteroidia bacterium]|nr:GAF domain-containing protein [Bacteroidia bacterium]